MTKKGISHKIFHVSLKKNCKSEELQGEKENEGSDGTILTIFKRGIDKWKKQKRRKL